jgi:general stress protein 26
MAAFPRRRDGVIYFLTDARRQKDDQIDQNPQVYLTFSHPRRQKYVSLVGRAEVNSDRGKIKELWSIAAKL